MFTKISNPTIEFYDKNTGQYLGTALVEFPLTEEKKILDLVNHGIIPSNFLITNSIYYNAHENYIPPTIDDSLQCTGLLKAYFLEKYSEEFIPIEIRASFDVRPRSIITGQSNYLISGQFSNVDIECISRLE